MTISHRGVQVYQDTVFDLLSETPGQVLAIRQSYDGVKVDNLSELPVQEPRRVAELIKYALKNRAVGGTLLNEVSSRSHMIVCVSVRTTNGLAKLNLVDLAGSERLQVELATNLHKDFTVTEFAPTRAFQSLSKVLLSVIVKSSRRFVASSKIHSEAVLFDYNVGVGLQPDSSAAGGAQAYYYLLQILEIATIAGNCIFNFLAKCCRIYLSS